MLIPSGGLQQWPCKDKRSHNLSPAKSTGSGQFPLMWIYIAVVGSILLRVSVIDFESGDYRGFLVKWYDYFLEHGRLTALKDDFTRYPLLYLYVISVSTLMPLPKLYAIKFFSILGDYVACLFVFKIARHRLKHPRPWIAALGFLFLPTVWLNSAVWGQCDVMVTAALLAVFFYILEERTVAAAVAFGFACALKPQAIFLVPFLVGWFLKERPSWWCVALPGLVYVFCGIPAMLAGKPILDVAFRWTQHRNIPHLTSGATNWYQWISNDYYEVFFLPGIVLALVAAGFLVLAMQQKRVAGRGPFLVTSAVASVLVLPYFLPGMHERYFYPADAFWVLYAFFAPQPRGWIVALLVEGCSFFTYLPYLFNQEPISRAILAIVMAVALGIVAVDLAQMLGAPKNDQEMNP